MGVEYEYCGECEECFHEDCFATCYNDYCGEVYEHKSGHGRYCIECGLNKLFIEIDEMIFCKNKKCYERYKKELEKELKKKESTQKVRIIKRIDQDDKKDNE
jgi:hypothetical protein